MNFETANIVIVTYPAGAGGKFLLNCLGLSENFLLQDINLAIQQIQGLLTTEKKFNLLQQRLRKITTTWNDLDLGCRELFGVDNIRYHRPVIKAQDIDSFNPELKTVIDSNCYFGSVNHSAYTLKKQLDVWNNATVIRLINTNDFVYHWRPYQVIESNNEYNSFSDIELPNVDIKKTIAWDCNNYFDADQFVHSMQELYKKFGLSDFDPDAIKILYDDWQQALNRVLYHWKVG